MILLFFLLFSLGSVSTLYQSYAVRGRLLCGDTPAESVTVKLFELDLYPHENDLLEDGKTDASGEFYLSGGTAEMTRIEPMLEVIHDCNDGNKTGHRKPKFLLPHLYITYGMRSLKTFDIGSINLETVFLSEDRDSSDDSV